MNETPNQFVVRAVRDSAQQSRDAQADQVSESRSTRRYTRRSKPSWNSWHARGHEFDIQAN